MRIVLLLCFAILTSACAGGSQDPGGAPTPNTTSTSTATTASPTTSDATVCNSLANTGKAFYERTYSAVMRKEQLTIEPIVLSAQLGALSTTGAPAGSIDGTREILQMSPALREKFSIMIRDADRLAQRYADAANGAIVSSDITPIVNSFTTALVACSEAGYQPSWFDPKSLIR